MTTLQKKIVSYFVVVLLFTSCHQLQRVASAQPKINGVSFVAPSRITDVESMAPVLKVNANWVCLMPYAFTDNNSTNVRFESENKWWGERPVGVRATIQHARELNLQIMLKPHLWLRHGAFTGDLDFERDTEWEAWENNYATYILTYAQIAEELKVELFCIGTELKNFVRERPGAWKSLIKSVKSIYSGKLVYAGNWDSYKDFPFWDDMDYVGIDAYFPLNDSKAPSVEALTGDWKRWFAEIKQFSKEHNKPILFTEFGYRNIDNCASRPWEAPQEKTAINHDCQCEALEALFTNFWDEKWFAGGFLWKWFDYHEKMNPKTDRTYSVQNKPAQKVLEKYYRK